VPSKHGNTNNEAEIYEQQKGIQNKVAQKTKYRSLRDRKNAYPCLTISTNTPKTHLRHGCAPPPPETGQQALQKPEKTTNSCTDALSAPLHSLKL